MITYTGISKTGSTNEYHFKGLSTDTKPTKTDYPDMENGSSFFEMDTKTTFYWDASGEDWI